MTLAYEEKNPFSQGHTDEFSGNLSQRHWSCCLRIMLVGNAVHPIDEVERHLLNRQKWMRKTWIFPPSISLYLNCIAGLWSYNELLYNKFCLNNKSRFTYQTGNYGWNLNKNCSKSTSCPTGIENQGCQNCLE